MNTTLILQPFSIGWKSELRWIGKHLRSNSVSDPLDEPIISHEGESHSLDVCKYEWVNRDLRRPTCIAWFFTLDFFIRSCISYPLQLQLSGSAFEGISPLKSPSLPPIRSRRILGTHTADSTRLLVLTWCLMTANSTYGPHHYYSQSGK